MSKTYIPVDIYRSDLSDCTNSGVTSPDFHNKFVVEVKDGFLSEEGVKERGYIILDPDPITIGGKTYMRLKPRGVEGWTMMGGNFAYTSDSRFRQLSEYPLAVHDRVE